jgi:N-sulfoglucosamine sulfohydrolase
MQPVSQRPNLLLITADDLNGDSTGWMDGKAGVTPNIDAFAASAHQFRNCHTVIPICQPSRSAFLTGRLPHRSGAAGFGPVRADVPTLTEILRANGYFTVAINKIKHMAPPEKFRWDTTFDGSGKDPATMRRQFEESVGAARETGKPFFINANSTDPHGPFPPSDELELNESDVEVPSFLEDLPEVRSEIARYFGAVRRLDQTLGEIIAALDASPHEKDTVVLFFADHGMSMPYSKATLYRNATWTPVLLRSHRFNPRVINDDLLSNIDIMPTILDLLGIAQPGGMDGHSWLPLLQRNSDRLPEFVFTQIDTVKSGRSFPSRCIRSKARSYIWNAWANGKTQFRIGAMANRQSWHAIVRAAERDERLQARVRHFIYRSREEFYDNTRDPDERKNLINSPEHAGEVGEMRRLLRDHMEQTDDPLAEEFEHGHKRVTRGNFWSRLRSR